MTSRDILTPVDDTDLAVTGGGKSFWKRILPVGTIDYTDNEGQTRKIEFSEKYLTDVKASFENRILDQTPFMLADADNRHTMDPERFRGEVVKMRMGGKDGPGLYGKIRFPSEKAADAVLSNPKLGVSARLREDVHTADGRSAPVAMIHVLGTLDPKITNLGDWEPDTDLSVYASEDVIDLSDQSYSEDQMPKGGSKTKTWDFATLTAEDIEAGKVTEDDIENMTDEQLAEFTAKLGEFAGDDDADGGDDDGDGNDDDTHDDDAPKDDTKMSNETRREIELANSRAVAAEQRAAATERRVIDADWKEKKRGYLAKGIPAAKIDLAEAVLKRPDKLVVDLSNTSFGGEQVNVAEIVEDLLLGYEGTIEVRDVELGHVGAGFEDGDEGDIDQELNAKYEAAFPHMASSTVLKRQNA